MDSLISLLLDMQHRLHLDVNCSMDINQFDR